MEARWAHIPEVRGFESRSRSQVRLAQFGRAPPRHGGCRGFKSLSGHSSRHRLWVSPGPFKAMKRVRAPLSRPIPSSSTAERPAVNRLMRVRFLLRERLRYPVAPGGKWADRSGRDPRRGRRSRGRAWKTRSAKSLGGSNPPPSASVARPPDLARGTAVCRLTFDRQAGPRTLCPSSSGEERSAHTGEAGGSKPSMGTVSGARKVERRVVVPEAAGSSPVTHPKRVRQRGRAGAVCKTVGFILSGFESRYSHVSCLYEPFVALV